jgi:dihydrofolate reductase
MLTRQANWHENGVQPMAQLHEALSFCEHMQPAPSEVWVIGGAQIYAQALPLAHKVVVTEIDANFEGDAFAPELGEEWREIQRESRVSTTGLACSFVTYSRITI